MNTLIRDLHAKLYKPGEAIHPSDFVANTGIVYDKIIGVKHKNPEEFTMASKILLDYGIHLANLKKFKQSIRVFNDLMALISDIRNGKQRTNVDDPTVERALLYRGVAYFKTREYKLASADLRLLVYKFPANHKYRNWYNKSVTAGLTVIQAVLGVLFVADALVYYHYKNDTSFYHTLSYSLLVGLIICFFVVDILKRRRKKR